MIVFLIDHNFEGNALRLRAILQKAGWLELVPMRWLTLEEVGCFESRSRAPVLWVGVRESPALTDLHAAVGSVLSGCGYIPEERKYSPHVTLARCTAKVPRGWVAEQIERHRGFVTPTVMVEAVTLFSSDTRAEGPVYTRQVVVPLRP